MGRAQWKKWPEFQVRFTSNSDGVTWLSARTYVEDGADAIAAQSTIALERKHLSNECMSELRARLKSEIEKLGVAVE